MTSAACELVDFEPIHAEAVISDIQPAHEGIKSELTALQSAVWAKMTEVGAAVSVIQGSTVLACGGVIYSDKVRGTALAWALLSSSVEPKNMIAIHRGFKGYIDSMINGGLQLFATVEKDFPQGIRWAKLLGFKHIGPYEGPSPTGKALELFERSRNASRK